MANDKVLYTTFTEGIDEAERLRKIKKKIKKMPNYLSIINFLIDKSIHEDSLLSDLINLNFKQLPCELFETIITMRPMEYTRISFKDIDFLMINELLELKDFKGDLTVYINVLDFVNVYYLFV